MSFLDGPARWCASRPLVAAVGLSALVTIPTAYGLEERMDDKTAANREKIEDVAEDIDDDEVVGDEPATPGDDEAGPTTTSTGTTRPGTPTTTPPPRVEVADEQILRVIVEFCRENDCAPIFADEREIQEPEIQDPEADNPEHQDPELQDAEIQDPSIPGPTGPAGPAGPACPAGYRLREVRIPSVSNQAIFLICARG